MKGFFIVLATALLLTCVMNAYAATYYIDYSTGSDSNNGLSKISPWKRHPYMHGWTGSYSHSAGDQFIFKGGVTWPNACFQMTISVGGSLGNVDYYGVDATWYTGGSWSRPIFDAQNNVLSSGSSIIHIQSGASYITVNNIEIRNLRFAGDAVYGQALIWVDQSGTVSNNIVVQNCYLHGWYRGSATTDDANAGGVIAVPTDGSLTLKDSTVDNSAGGSNIGGLIKGWDTVENCILHDAPNGALSVNRFIGNELYNT